MTDENVIWDDEHTYTVEKDGVITRYHKPQRYEVTSGTTVPFPTQYIQEMRDAFSDCDHKWIKCSDRMPELKKVDISFDDKEFRSDECLVYNFNFFIARLFTTTEEPAPAWLDDDYDEINCVTHWMKLPEEPNELD